MIDEADRDGDGEVNEVPQTRRASASGDRFFNSG